MPRSWQYPRWRRYAMQGAMWVVLGATVALAAFVNHERRRALRVELGPAVEHGDVAVRLPAKWQPLQQPPGASGGAGQIVARVVERAGDGDAGKPPAAADLRHRRVLTVYRERVPEPVTPVEYLLTRAGLRDLVDLSHGPADGRSADDLLPYVPIRVADWPGVMVLTERAGRADRVVGDLSDADGDAGARKELFACAVLPSRTAVVLKLEGPGEIGMSDQEVLRQLAAAVRFADAPQVGRAGEMVAMESGVRVRTPEGMLPVYDNDPNRLERLVWFEGDARSWLTAELVPCVLLPEGSDERRAVATIAATRDPRLSRANVEADGPRRWKFESPPSPEDELCPTRWYLLADDRTDEGRIGGGPRRALLAVLRAAPGNGWRLDGAWDALASATEFVGDADYSTMLATGAEAVDRLRRRGLSTALTDRMSGDDWWLWFDGAGRANLGWSRVTWDAAAATGRARVSRRSGADGPALRIDEEWSGGLAGDFSAFAQVGDGPAALKQITRVTDADVTTELATPGRQVATWKRATPPEFLPGAWLPLLIGSLPRDRGPMILRTDAFVGHPGPTPPDPMTLVVSFPAAAPATRLTESGEPAEPSRVVSVHLNGSGQATRWHVRPDGRVEQVDFPAGVQRQLKDQHTIKLLFGDVGNDPPAAP